MIECWHFINEARTLQYNATNLAVEPAARDAARDAQNTELERLLFALEPVVTR